MTGLKSGSGDDLWGDDGEDDDSETAGSDSGADAGTDRSRERSTDRSERADSGSAADDDAEPTDEAGASDADADEEAGSDESDAPSEAASQSSTGSGDSGLSLDASAADSGGSGNGQPYIVRRAVQDKSVQFERDERLTFFVHDDVAEGERDLITEVQSTLGRDVPKFDVREAVYRAALRNPDDVLAELVEMGYSVDEE